MDGLADFAYLVAAVAFILGLKRLGSPATARSGNRLAAIGMLVAVVVALLDRGILDYRWVLGVLVLVTAPALLVSVLAFDQADEAGLLADLVAQQFVHEPDLRQELLETTSTGDRVRMLCEFFAKLRTAE